MENNTKKQSLVGFIVVWVVLTALFTWMGLWAPGHFMPRSMSDNMHLTIETIVIFTISAAPVAAGVYAAAWHLLRNHLWRGEGVPPAAAAVRENGLLTGGWLIASTILTVFLLVWGLGALAVDNGSTGSNPLVVNVTGQQWLWSFSYPGTNVQSPTLMLPDNRTVVFHITALDVTHGFWVANMGVQVDANVGVVTTIHTTPDKLGTFNIRCDQFCGLNHAFMTTTGQVLTPAKFNSWLAHESQIQKA